MNERANDAPLINGSGVDKTRLELIRFLSAQRDDKLPPHDRRAQSGESSRSVQGNDTDDSGFNWSRLVAAGLSSWWRDHPMRAGVVLCRSAVEDIARRKPLQVAAVAAVAGAAVVLLKPWRLLSASTVMLTLLRSSNFTGAAASMIETVAQSMQKERT